MKVVSGILSALVVCAGAYLKFHRVSRIMDTSQQSMSEFDSMSGFDQTPIHGEFPDPYASFGGSSFGASGGGGSQPYTSKPAVSTGVQENPFFQ